MQVARPYQREAVDSVFREWSKENVRKTLGVAPTGAGKTNIACDVIRGVLPKRTIFLAHRIELVQQAVNRLASFGIEAGIEQGFRSADDTLFGKKPVIVATPQTLFASSDKRLKQFDPADFGCLIIDECFVAGTLVDGRRIEKIQVGDRVFCMGRQGIERRAVKHLFKSKPSALLRVSFRHGPPVICTPGHPFLSEGKWIPAFLLVSDAMVSRLITNETIASSANSMRRMWNDRNVFREVRPSLRPQGASVLFAGMPSQIMVPSQLAFNGQDESQTCLGTDEGSQSHEEARSQGESFQHSSGNRAQSCLAGWQWQTTDRSGNASGESAELDYQPSRSYQDGQTQRFSELLQIRCWESTFETRNRNRRTLSRHNRATRKRPKETGFFGVDWVDRVEVLEPTSDGTFGGLCPDGCVYNLEVEEYHNYFANGVLVHNCHHYVADAFARPLRHFCQNPHLKVLGLTATADRADGEALSQIMDSVAFNIEICSLIEDGWLVPIDQQMVKIEGLDFSRCRVTAGDLNGRDLEEVMREEKNMLGVADASLKTIGDKRAIVFCVSVKQAERLAEIFNRYRAKSADWVYAGTPAKAREEKLSCFASGETQIMVNVGVLTEGYDNPAIEVVVQARPTKSRSLYAQMIGRGMRALTGVLHEGLADKESRKLAIAVSAKPKLVVLDFAGNSGRHKLITTADILGGKISEEAKDRAIAKIRESGKAVNITEAMLEEEARIHREIEEAKKRAAAKRANLTAEATFTATYVDPFDAIHRNAEKWRTFKQRHPLSAKQRQIILGMGLNPDDRSLEENVQLINAKFAMSEGQRRVLLRAGYSPEELEGLRKWDASKLIDVVSKHNWSRPKAESIQ